MSGDSNRILVPETLPFLQVTAGVILPGTTVRVPCRAAQNISMIEHRLMNMVSLRNAMIGIVFHRQKSGEANSRDEFYTVGVAALVTQVVGTNWPRPSYTLQLTGVCRIRIGKIIYNRPYMYATVEQLDKFPGKLVSIDRKDGDAKKFLEDVNSLIKLLPPAIAVVQLKKVLESAPLDYVTDLVSGIANCNYEEKISVLTSVDLKERIGIVHGFVKRQLELTSKPGDETNGNFQVEVFPESVKVDDVAKMLINSLINRDAFSSPKITKNIGGGGVPKGGETDDLEAKLKAANMPPDVEKVAMDEYKRMKMAGTHSHEYPLIRQYLELLATLPWAIETADTLDVLKARSDLDDDHYGLESVKKRILEYLAVKKMQNTLKGPILCFVGPPGVGKTSIGRSIAKTLGRKFHRISVGGISDQTDIRGFNRTYVASMPGRIINGLKVVQAKNPVFLLDEVDKMCAGMRGDPAAALLEVLDPEQNYHFVDHYLNVPFDLSKVLFIATANSAAEIAAPLLDRMEVITIAGYTAEEKMAIAKKYLIPKQLKEHGLNDEHVSIPENSLRLIVQRYTREAGVRTLERKLGAIMRAVAVKAAEHLESAQEKSKKEPADSVDIAATGSLRIADFPVIIDEHAVEDILGHPLFTMDGAENLSMPGVAAGLAWTPYGGEIMYVEATKMEGEGKLTLTGQLGDVMKESASVGLNWLRSHAGQLGIPSAHGTDLLGKTDVHIHFPSGAISKDGPSAGVTVIVALASLFSNRCVRSDTAMTGEITLRGLVLQVGGVKEKLLAARRAGFTRVILPKKNAADVSEMASDLTNSMEIVQAEKIDDVLNAAFDGGFPKLIPSKL